jgi:hypothetical protein
MMQRSWRLPVRPTVSSAATVTISTRPWLSAHLACAGRQQRRWGTGISRDRDLIRYRGSYSYYAYPEWWGVYGDTWWFAPDGTGYTSVSGYLRYELKRNYINAIILHYSSDSSKFPASISNYKKYQATRHVQKVSFWAEMHTSDIKTEWVYWDQTLDGIRPWVVEADSLVEQVANEVLRRFRSDGWPAIQAALSRPTRPQTR